MLHKMKQAINESLQSVVRLLVEEQEAQTADAINSKPESTPTVCSIFDQDKSVVVHSDEQSKELERLLCALVNARQHFSRGSSERLLFVAAAKAVERKLRSVNKNLNKKEVLTEPGVASLGGGPSEPVSQESAAITTKK